MIDDATVAGRRDRYLLRLGVELEPPSIDALFRLHRAHVERVPYETTWIHLGERWGIDQDASVSRVVDGGRGGYCFHLNGSLAWLLDVLGYDVSFHIGGVHGETPSTDDLTNHLVLVVDGLPGDGNERGSWYVDVGLGDALHEPMPLAAHTATQGLMTFTLEESADGVGDWHLSHDPLGSFPGMNFEAAPVPTLEPFAARHVQLSTSPDSGFVRTPTAQRRLADRVVIVRGLTYSVRDASGTTSRVIDDPDAWFELLADEFLLPLDGVADRDRQRLWRSAVAAHEARLADG